MNEHEKEIIETAFNAAQKRHESLVDDWTKNRDTVLATIDYLGLVSARFGKNWRNWIGVDGAEKRRALKTCKKLQKAVAECKAQLYQLTENVL